MYEHLKVQIPLHKLIELHFGSTNVSLKVYPDHRATMNFNVILELKTIIWLLPAFNMAFKTRIDALLKNLLRRVCCVQKIEGVV